MYGCIYLSVCGCLFLCLSIYLLLPLISTQMHDLNTFLQFGTLPCNFVMLVYWFAFTSCTAQMTLYFSIAIFSIAALSLSCSVQNNGAPHMDVTGVKRFAIMTLWGLSDAYLFPFSNIILADNDDDPNDFNNSLPDGQIWGIILVFCQRILTTWPWEIQIQRRTYYMCLCHHFVFCVYIRGAIENISIPLAISHDIHMWLGNVKWWLQYISLGNTLFME